MALLFKVLLLHKSLCLIYYMHASSGLMMILQHPIRGPICAQVLSFDGGFFSKFKFAFSMLVMIL